jgi:hypothetical protein
MINKMTLKKRKKKITIEREIIKKHQKKIIRKLSIEIKHRVILKLVALI